MPAHDLWHVAVLGSTLFAAAGVALLLLAPLAFDVPPPGLRRARPAILGLAAVAVVLLTAEWLWVH